MITEKIVEGYKVINHIPDMTEDERKKIIYTTNAIENVLTL